jgi:hypothetical protein
LPSGRPQHRGGNGGEEEELDTAAVYGGGVRCESRQGLVVTTQEFDGRGGGGARHSSCLQRRGPLPGREGDWWRLLRRLSVREVVTST